jgi:hypothetical protein
MAVNKGRVIYTGNAQKSTSIFQMLALKQFMTARKTIDAVTRIVVREPEHPI